MELFEQPASSAGPPPPGPLADRMRPRSIDEIVGQEHLLGPGRVLRAALERGELHSMILWGPPGSGKTTLASLMAHVMGARFVAFSAVLSGVKEIRQVVAEAALAHIARLANGDARAALNVLELASQLAAGGTITAATIREAGQRRTLLYDKSGEEHYNLTSALHKSLRDSDPDASLYWMTRMLDSGEDPLYG